jgi:inosose dehydratase
VRLASGPVCWGVDFNGHPANPRWDEVLDGIAAAGYAGTELGPPGYLPSDPEALAARGLALAGGFVFEPLHEPREQRRIVRLAAEVARTVGALGGEYLLIIDSVTPARNATAGSPGDAPRLPAAARDAMGETVEAVAAAARACGVVPLLHPHCGTYVEFADEIAPLAVTCGICVDTGHFAYAGIDPVAYVSAHAGAVGCIHLKDLDRSAIADGFWESVAAGAFVPLGRGCVGFGALLAAAADAGYDRWMVIEQDRSAKTGDPVSDLLASRRYLEGLACG